jgi:hypothetical protein
MNSLYKLSCTAFLLSAGLFPVQTWAQTTIEADFSQRTDNPLVKKFDVYQTPLAGIDRLLRDQPLLKEAQIRSLRFETAWGKNIDFNSGQISGSASNLVYNRADYTRFVQGVVANGTAPLLTHGYCPTPLKPGSDWRQKPSNLTVWGKVNQDYADYWKSKAIHPMYEIWNEPDFDIFFTGTKDDYFSIYNLGAKGVRAGDADAKVGGPVTAFTGWYKDFLAYVKSNQLPLDFISGHAYANAPGQLNAIREALGKNEWPQLETYLTEYASYATVPDNDIRPGGKIERYVAAADFFKDATMFLTYPDLGKVYWAMWSDTEWGEPGNWYPSPGDKMGMVDLTGRRKGLYNAFKIYNQLPVDRNVVTINGNGLGALASSDAHTAGTVVWNQQETATSVTINLKKLPFATGTATLYRIDSDHASYYETGAKDQLEVLETIPVNASAFTWTGNLPAKGTVYWQIKDNTGESELAANPVAAIVRTHHWFADRSNTPYADFDEQTAIVRLGMGNGTDLGVSQVGVVLENVPTKLHFAVSQEGEPKDLDKNSTLAIRLDYQSGNGTYGKSVLLHGGLYHADRDLSLPWGKGGQADVVVAQGNWADFTVSLLEYAPADFRGRVLVSYLMQHTGKDSRAKIKMSKASEERIPLKDLVIVTSVKKNEKLNEQASLYPNPVGEKLFLPLPFTKPTTVRLSIADMLGKTVWVSPEQIYLPNDKPLEINTAGLENGLYVLRVTADHEPNYQQKFMKIH